MNVHTVDHEDLMLSLSEQERSEEDEIQTQVNGEV